jgi:TrmH family RNA methyltransferase
MLSKKVLKDIQSLSAKKQRREQGLFLAEGPKIAAELIALIPSRIVGIWATQSWIDRHEDRVAGLPLESITDAELLKISQLQTPSEVLLVARQEEAIEPTPGPGITLYLDTIQDPGNFGTILRIADWFGVNNVVCSAGCADRYNPKVVQATMGSIARVNVWYDEEGTWLDRQTVPVLAAALEGEPLYTFVAPPSAVLLIGNEGNGLRPELLGKASSKLTIPRIGAAESLNAAVATGIILSRLT